MEERCRRETAALEERYRREIAAAEERAITAERTTSTMIATSDDRRQEAYKLCVVKHAGLVNSCMTSIVCRVLLCSRV